MNDRIVLVGAGNMATAAFLAPLMVTVPSRGRPPIISYLAKDFPLLAVIFSV